MDFIDDHDSVGWWVKPGSALDGKLQQKPNS